MESALVLCQNQYPNWNVSFPYHWDLRDKKTDILLTTRCFFFFPCLHHSTEIRDPFGILTVVSLLTVARLQAIGTLLMLSISTHLKAQWKVYFLYTVWLISCHFGLLLWQHCHVCLDTGNHIQVPLFLFLFLFIYGSVGRDGHTSTRTDCKQLYDAKWIILSSIFQRGKTEKLHQRL